MELSTERLIDRFDALLPRRALARVLPSRPVRQPIVEDEPETLPDPITPLRPRLVIPMIERTAEDDAREAQFERAQKLSRQDRWDDLHDAIAEADASAATTPAGTPVADLIAFGARADIVAAAASAVRKREFRKARAIMLELEEVLEDYPGLYGVSAIVARAHMDVGLAWRGSDTPDKVPPRHWSAYSAHFARATRLLKDHDPFALNSPLLAASRCTALTGHKRPAKVLPRAYEDLIDLDPACPAHLRALGIALLPSQHGSLDVLEREARRTAAHTRDVWGHGGYAWVYMDAIRRDPSVLSRIEAESFVAGLHDITERRPDQHTANLIAALCGVSVARHARRNEAAARIHGCFGWVLRDHLREVHPMQWALALGDPGIDALEEPARIKTGRARAFAAIAEHFGPEIAEGNRVIFEDGALTVAPEDQAGQHGN